MLKKTFFGKIFPTKMGKFLNLMAKYLQHAELFFLAHMQLGIHNIRSQPSTIDWLKHQARNTIYTMDNMYKDYREGMV